MGSRKSVESVSGSLSQSRDATLYLWHMAAGAFGIFDLTLFVGGADIEAKFVAFMGVASHTDVTLQKVRIGSVYFVIGGFDMIDPRSKIFFGLWADDVFVCFEARFDFFDAVAVGAGDGVVLGGVFGIGAYAVGRHELFEVVGCRGMAPSTLVGPFFVEWVFKPDCFMDRVFEDRGVGVHAGLVLFEDFWVTAFAVAVRSEFGKSERGA